MNLQNISQAFSYLIEVIKRESGTEGLNTSIAIENNSSIEIPFAMYHHGETGQLTLELLPYNNDNDPAQARITEILAWNKKAIVTLYPGDAIDIKLDLLKGHTTENVEVNVEENKDAPEKELGDN